MRAVGCGALTAGFTRAGLTGVEGWILGALDTAHADFAGAAAAATLAAVGAAEGPDAMNFAWFAALTASGMVIPCAGAAFCFAACGLDSLHFSRSSSISLPLW